MNWIELVLGQLPEAIYFALFMIYAKNLQNKKLLFSLTVITEYFILKYLFKYNIWFHVSYTFMLYAILKVYYKEKAQITDIFTFMIGSLILMIITIPVYFIINIIYPNILLVALFSRLILFTLLFKLNYKLYKIQNLYKKFWNRNDKYKKKIKSVTFRCWNLVVFNFMFYVLSLFLNYILIQ